ncbi:S-type pyocin domain-containing protein [Pseudomonas syringae]|nr:S-type pyocin domain-containing protein [Pseudomonas syringae]MBD8791793.1 S-type pyocin domain-containing protein [Pseudomonas syringae]MBD8801153.1 S-type pyocin domain-containing protein [Pseudomonas syringae]MBD8810557.1 S-type pyocin domain-containing protein [Pseudomonas syringae]
MGHKKHPPGQLEIPATYITETEYRGAFGSPGGGAGWGHDPRGMPDPSRNSKDLAGLEFKKYQFHQARAAFEQSRLDQAAEEITAVKRNIVLADNASSLDRAALERDAVDALLHRKTTEYLDTLRRSEDYFGDSPLNKGFREFIDTFNARYKDLPVDIRARSLDRWEASYQAALLAEVQAKVAHVVRVEAERLHTIFNEFQRAAQRETEAHARHLAEQREAKEQARRLAEQREAQEQARRLAEQREAEEQARHLAEQREAQEQARRLAEQREAQEQARHLAEQREAQEQARRLAEQEAAEQQALRLRHERLVEAIEAAHEASLSSVPHPARIVRPLVSALINSPPARAAAVRAANSLIKAIEGFGRSADELGNDLVRQAYRALESLRTTFQDFGEFFSASIPAAEVVPQDAPQLSEIAAQGGSVNVPGWASLLGSNTIIGSIELAASDVTAAAPVEVRSATFNERNKTWSVAFPGNPGATLIWTPIAPPIDSSTALPGSPLSEAPYIGRPLSPVEPAITPLPVAPPGLQGLITVFPADSGLPPLFTVFNSPYPGATFKGIYSGRYYNPKKAGGPILSLSWVDAVLTQEGIALVKLHTGRLDYSAANDVMIARLEKILKGELQITDTDKRYYTHEIRELERYRAVGVLDGPVPQEIKGEVWNNAHTATLEDFKLKDDKGLFYTEAANAAHEKHEQKELEDFQRGMFK